MNDSSKIKSPEYTDLNQVFNWFIYLRWIAAAGVFISIISAKYYFGLVLPYRILIFLNITLIIINVFFSVFFSTIKQQNLSPDEMNVFFNLQIICDYIILFFLVYFTGFLDNPFSYYFVFHIMLTSFIFPSSVLKYYVTLLVVFLGSIVTATYYGLLPTFSLAGPLGVETSGIRIIQFTALLSTLGISAYLITSIKGRIEERGKKAAIELNHYKSLDKIKSDFMLQVTHELRGPIAALMGYHEMIMKGITGNVNPKTNDAIAKAHRRSENLLSMIDEMLDYAYIKSDEGVHTDLSAVDIKSVIDYNINLFSNAASEKCIVIVSNCPKGLMVLANRDLLNIISNNLISNALKYSMPGAKITINATVEDNKVHVLVKDQGIGIAPEELLNVFDEFYRTRKSREMEKDGTGLGLPIVKKAIERLNGEISVYSEAKKGTTFHYYLPLYFADIN